MSPDLPPLPWQKIISGAQTGADRGGLEAAYDLNLARGGWAPQEWRAEDGQIPPWYRDGMRESASRAYTVRTHQNVQEGDATLILSLGELTAESGSMLTANLARRLRKPCRHVVIPGDGTLAGVALDRTAAWIEQIRPRILNVAGPRESKEPGLQAATRKAIAVLFHATRR